MNIERRSIEFIPEGERYGSASRLFTVWFSVNMQVTALLVGTLSVLEGLNLFWTFVALTIGSVIGAIFMAAGLWFKNPMIAVAVVLIWENMNPFLPSLLKKFSVIFYLKGLCPVDVPMSGSLSLIEVLTNPTPAWIAIPGLLILTVVVLVAACFSVRRMEVSYGE